jgi:micrococcal nuclease
MIPDMVLARVEIDGDTLIVSAGSHLRTPDNLPLDGETIRLLGVDTPEIEHPPDPAECYGPEAKDFTQSEIGGRTIELTYDVQNGVRDDFMRLLAYVSRNGQVHNEQLIRTGNARAFRPFDHRERSRYIALEQEARDQNLGLWACP